MNIGFITNIEKDYNLDFTKKLIDYVIKNGASAILNCKFSNILSKVDFVENDSQLCQNADFVIVLGGDGTMLGVARKSAFYKTPILGINLGTLGYLTDVEKKDAIKAIDKVFNNEYTIEKRMMLEACLENETAGRGINIALNEVCVNNTYSRMIKIKLEINNNFINECKCDGIIVSTPTGSTAYSLSAGGPILKPDTELIAITHVCPHNLYTRPFVVSGDDVVKISACSNYDNIMMVSFDGQECVDLKNDDKIVIKRSQHCTRIIKTTALSFYDILRRKMVEVRK